MNLDPSTTKYMIRAVVKADGVIEKPDVVGAVFGQTEGLLGTELDMRDLQKAARIGRIEVEIDAKKGKSEGTIYVPSAMDKVETAIIAAGLESIDRVGPCKATITVEKIDDVRSSRRTQIVNRAKELLHEILEDEASDSGAITGEVRQAVQSAEITAWGSEKLPAGPGVVGSDDVIFVEGRNDVVNLLRCGIRNAVSVEGTNVPKSVIELSKEKVTTIFIDGDRGGELIARELLGNCEIDFVARAPQTREVEELPHKLVMKALNNKMPAEQFAQTFGMSAKKSGKSEGKAQTTTEPKAEKEPRGRGRTRGRGRKDEDPEAEAEREPRGRGRGRGRKDEETEAEPEREPRGRGRGRRDEDEDKGRARPARRDEDEDKGRARPARREEDEDKGRGRPARRDDKKVVDRPKKVLSPELQRYKDILGSVSGSLKAVLLDVDGKEVKKDIPVRELADTLKSADEEVRVVVFDGVITQRLLDIASDRSIETVVGVKVGNVTQKPEAVQVVTKGELE